MDNQDAFSTFGSILLVIFTLIAAVTIVGLFMRQSQISSLRQNGKRVTATIMKIERRRKAQTQWLTTSAGPSFTTFPLSTWHTSYYVLAQWEDPQTHQVYTFTSGPRSSRPREYEEGSPVTVFFDPDHPDHHYVDLSER